MNGLQSKQLSVREIFSAAISLSDLAQRYAYLQQVCGNDAVLRHKVEQLLKGHPDHRVL